jgi:cytochrome c-type biogenesis protein CcmE
MTHRYIKIGATVSVLLLAFAGLMWTSLREGTEYFKNIDEVIDNKPAWEGKRLQLHGYVVPGTWMKNTKTLEYRFKVQNNPARQAVSGGVVDAAYTGILPDTFKDEAEVVLKGRFSPNGGFEVDTGGVMAKCPSKYQEQEKAAGGGGASGS